MYKHIMLPIDGSESSLRAAKEGVAFAKAIKARLTAMQVVEHFHAYLDIGDDAVRPEAVEVVERSHDEETRKSAEKTLARVGKLARDNGVECHGVLVVGDDPSSEIVENAAKHHCDLILMASHAYAEPDETALGSETTKVAGNARVPVLVVH